MVVLPAVRLSFSYTQSHTRACVWHTHTHTHLHTHTHTHTHACTHTHAHTHTHTHTLACMIYFSFFWSLTLKSFVCGRTVLLIMSEMVQTERDYTRSLQYIIENYIPELQRVDVPQLMRGKRNVIFGNVEKIYQFHAQYFLRELEACEHNPFLVGHYFLRHVSHIPGMGN